ncbi:MAG: CoA pyrophosphatase [Gemmatimonadetes bacterium]|nr:CoA pyrophosphatase [Gemmatimonadota bacterium]
MTEITLDRLRRGLSGHTPVRIDDPAAAQAAVALVVVPAAGDLDVLFIRRAEMPGDPWSGHIALPGGRRHSADEDLRETATREAREEVGVTLTPGDFVAELDEVTPRSRVLRPIVVRPYLFGLGHRPDLSLSSEVADWLWVPLTVLCRSRGEAVVEVQGSSLRVPAFTIGSTVVWGLTERIVNHFINLLDMI